MTFLEASMYIDGSYGSGQIGVYERTINAVTTNKVNLTSTTEITLLFTGRKGHANVGFRLAVATDNNTDVNQNNVRYIDFPPGYAGTKILTLSTVGLNGEYYIKLGMTLPVTGSGSWYTEWDVHRVLLK